MADEENSNAEPTREEIEAVMRENNWPYGKARAELRKK